jgi:hypothetical protein
VTRRHRAAGGTAALALAAIFTAGSALALDGAVDNCASLLGSLSKELHFARALAPGQRTSFACPRERELRPAIGASGERVLRALGTPDASGSDDHGSPTWTYVFASTIRDEGTRGGGFPLLSFHFGPTQQVESVDCALAK